MSFRSLAALIVVCESQSQGRTHRTVPREALLLAQIAKEILTKNGHRARRASWSRYASRRREAEPNFFPRLAAWLRSPQAVDAFRRAGTNSDRRKLAQACDAIARRVKPHVALGLDKPGKPRSYRFDRGLDAAAIMADLRHRGIPYSAALNETLHIVDCVDEATVRRGLKLLNTFSAADVAQWATDARVRYGGR